MPWTADKYGKQHRRNRRSLLDRNRRNNGGLCIHCGIREATVADHQPPLSMFVNAHEWEGEMVPSCKPCSDRQGQQLAVAKAARRREQQGPSRRWV